MDLLRHILSRFHKHAPIPEKASHTQKSNDSGQNSSLNQHNNIDSDYPEGNIVRENITVVIDACNTDASKKKHIQDISSVNESEDCIRDVSTLRLTELSNNNKSISFERVNCDSQKNVPCNETKQNVVEDNESTVYGIKDKKFNENVINTKCLEKILSNSSVTVKKVKEKCLENNHNNNTAEIDNGINRLLEDDKKNAQNSVLLERLVSNRSIKVTKVAGHCTTYDINCKNNISVVKNNKRQRHDERYRNELLGGTIKKGGIIRNKPKPLSKGYKSKKYTNNNRTKTLNAKAASNLDSKIRRINKSTNSSRLRDSDISLNVLREYDDDRIKNNNSKLNEIVFCLEDDCNTYNFQELNYYNTLSKEIEPGNENEIFRDELLEIIVLKLHEDIARKCLIKNQKDVITSNPGNFTKAQVQDMSEDSEVTKSMKYNKMFKAATCIKDKNIITLNIHRNNSPNIENNTEVSQSMENDKKDSETKCFEEFKNIEIISLSSKSSSIDRNDSTNNGDPKEVTQNMANSAENGLSTLSEEAYDIETISLSSEGFTADNKPINAEVIPAKAINTDAEEILKDILAGNLIDSTINAEAPISDTDDCGYHSSDFEFITEEEAKKDGIIINFNSERHIAKTKASIGAIKSSASTRISIATNNVHNDPYGPGPSSRNPGIFNHGREKIVIADKSYMKNYAVPQENELNNMFHAEIPGLPLSELHMLENKSVRTRAPMLVQYEGVGFDMNLVMHRIDSSDDEEYRDEARETYEKILQMYPDVNTKRKRRHRHRDEACETYEKILQMYPDVNTKRKRRHRR